MPHSVQRYLCEQISRPARYCPLSNFYIQSARDGKFNNFIQHSAHGGYMTTNGNIAAGTTRASNGQRDVTKYHLGCHYGFRETNTIIYSLQSVLRYVLWTHSYRVVCGLRTDFHES
jgi:hypothetical protein